MKVQKNKIIFGIIIVFFVIFFIFEKFINNDEYEVVEEQNFVMENQDDSESSKVTEEKEFEQEENVEKEESADNKIYVYVTGEVINSGVVILNSGSRIIDAINAAGGTTDKADVSKVNLAYVLQDGMKVNIPNSDDLKEQSNFDFVTTGSGDNAEDNLDFIDENKIDGEPKTTSLININTASQTELESLPGIGPSIALKIIKYRTENGKFANIEDIKNVSGIGDSKFEEIKDFICI